jgi:hypothetical protein
MAARSGPAYRASMPAAHARSASLASDPVSQFFGMLAQPGHLTTFEGESATLRFDLLDGQRTDRWYLTVADGEVAVTRRGRPAAAVVRIERPRFEAMVTGRLNAQAALLRGLLTVEGDIAALMMFQRCLPGPPGSRGRVDPITSRQVMAERKQELSAS